MLAVLGLFFDKNFSLVLLVDDLFYNYFFTMQSAAFNASSHACPRSIIRPRDNLLWIARQFHIVFIAKSQIKGLDVLL